MRRWPFVIGCLLLPIAAAAQTTPTTTAPALMPIPSSAAQSKARTMIHEVFKDDFAKTTAAARTALAQRLVAEGSATKDDTAARYVLLSDGADMAAGAGDSQTAMNAIDQLARLYDVDAMPLRKAALVRASTAVTTPDGEETLARLSLAAANEAALADAFEVVTQLTNLAEAAATKSHKLTFVASIQVPLANLRGLTAEYAHVRQALDELVKKPDDAAAHLVVGKFYALLKGQWQTGLPHLAAGADSELRTLATKELAGPSDGLGQTQLGDRWWDYATKSTGLTRTQVTEHARLWYARSEKSLSGITLARIRERLGGGANALPAADPTAPNIKSPAITGNAVNILALIDPAKDAAEGKWSLDAGSLLVASGKYSTLQLPFTVPEEYDLRVTFNRTEGQGPIEILLANHKHSFGLALDVKGEARFERVANKIAKNNPTTAPIAISNNRKYTVTVQVRHDGVRALLGEKPLTQWKTDYKDMSRYVLWKLPDEKLCGLGANNAKVIFYSVELIEVAGTGKPLR